MAEGGGHYDPYSIDKDDDPNPSFPEEDDDDDDDDEPTNPFRGDTTGPFRPYEASTPYHGGEKHEMQTTMHEQSGLPSYDESTPLLSELERRVAALREDPRTGIIDTTHIDASINPLSEEDRAKQIERVKRLIKAEYPNAQVDKLVISFSKKNPMDIVVYGPKGGETKIVLNDGSGLQKSFLKQTFVKKVLGPPGREIIENMDIHIMKRQKELEKERENEIIQKRKDEEIQGLAQRVEKEEAKIDQLKENQGPGYEEEMKMKEQLLKTLKKDLKTKQKEREELQKKIKTKEKTQEKIGQLQSSIYEEERKRNELEENLYSTKTFDALKEHEIHLQRLNEEDRAIIQDEMTTSFDKEAAEERVAARNEEIARLQTQVADREAAMPLRERVKEIK